MIKKIIQAIFIGLFVAVLVLILLPRYNPWVSHNNPMSFSNAVRIASPAVVNVYSQSFSPEGSQLGNSLQLNNLGSGVIMSTDGYILTNRHVIENADQVVVALQTGKIFEAHLVGADTLTDLAVLKINAENLPIIPQNPDRQIHVGDIALAIGNPYNLGQSISQGIISATGRTALGEFGRQNFIQTDASVNRGNSGGALINSLGELVGINTLSIGKDSTETAEGLNFAIPISLANTILQKIKKDGRVIRGYFGVQARIFYGEGQNASENEGFLVTSVDPNGPAAEAGIRGGDMIVRFDGTDATSPEQIMQVIAETPPYKVVDVVVSRAGKRMTVPVKIREYIISN